MIEDNNSQGTASQKHIWITIGVGVFTFVVGLFSGFIIRPLVSPEPQETQVSALVDQPGVIPPQPGNEEVMAYLVSETRHFKGNPEAPVTMIEFSDFK